MSIEREVAFNSGRTVCDHLDQDLYDVIPLFQSAQGNLYILPFSFLYRGKIADFQDRLHEAQEVFWDDLPQLNRFYVYCNSWSICRRWAACKECLKCLRFHI